MNPDEIYEDIAIRQMIDDITDRLAAMAREERLAWFRDRKSVV